MPLKQKPLKPKRFMTTHGLSGRMIGGAGLITSLLVAACGGDSDSQSLDPLYSYQWHLRNTGQIALGDVPIVAGVDLNMGTLFQQGVTGKGVVVGIVEGGTIDPLHEDLADNLILKDGAGAAPPASAAAHTTADAGIIAAVANNGRGGRGVAPEAKILDMRAPGAATQPPPPIINMSETMPAQGFTSLSMDDLDSDTTAQPSTAATPLIVKSAGNDFLHSGPLSFEDCAARTRNSGVGCMPAGVDPTTALPSAMVVAAINATGKKASYSSTGSVLWIAAPGGELGHQRDFALQGGPLPDRAMRDPLAFFAPAITTTDVSGCDLGVNKTGATANALDFGPASPIDKSCNYTAIANGTSSAAPMVSGIAALMLQVNPALSWRDIKYILGVTARKIQLQEPDVRWNGFVVDSGWVTNAAGHAFSNRYGFGLADATAAVNLARHFRPLPPQASSQWLGYEGAPVAIPYRQENAGMTSIVIGDDLKTETVQIRLRTTHRRPGNLRIALISPSGTRSIVMPALTGVQLMDDQFEIGLTASNAFLDESSKGVWKLQIVDVLDPASAQSSALTSWQLKIVGHRAT